MENNLKTVHQYIGPIFLSDSLFGTLIAENFRYLTDVGLHDAITIMSLISDSLFGTLIAENFRYLTDVGLYDAITIMSLIFTFET